VVASDGGLALYLVRHAFASHADPARWLMASSVIVKPSNFFIDALESAYVWDPRFVSVANKKVRQPYATEWVEGGQRCLENIVLNFCASKATQEELDRLERDRVKETVPIPSSPQSWMGI